MSMVHLYPPDVLLVYMIATPMLTMSASIIGRPTPVERNLSSQSSSTVRLKCRQVISITWWGSGRRMGPNGAKNPPFLITGTFTIQLMLLTPATSPGNHLASSTMARGLSSLKSPRGWTRSILFGFATHAFLSAIYYQTLTSRILSTPHLTRSTTQRIATDIMTSCQAIGHGGTR